MRRLLASCWIASVLASCVVGYVLPRPRTVPRPAAAAAAAAADEEAFREEMHRLTISHSRQLQDALHGLDGDDPDRPVIYREWKARRADAVRDLHLRHGRTPP